MSWLGRQRVALDTCVSTNDEAAAAAADGAVHGAVFTARHQTRGRGRAGHSWHSPPGENLYLSIVLRPSLPTVRVPPVTLAGGLGVADAVNALGLRASLKWPNDVLVRGRKLAGILTETSSVAGADKLDYAVMGIGLNIDTQSFPSPLDRSATSLALELAPRRPPDHDRVLDDLLGALERRLDQFFARGVSAIADDWMAAAAAGHVRAVTGRDVVEGRACGLDELGALLIEDDAGLRHRVVAGEVTLTAPDHRSKQ